MASLTCPGVFAAGDAAAAAWVVEEAHNPHNPHNPRHHPHHWFPMRLWGQARAAGLVAARGMTGAAEEDAAGFAFELFTHATRFFGLRVVLLGRYNAQGLEGEPEADIRSYVREVPPPGDGEGGGLSADTAHFARVVLLRGRMVGAALIGEEAVGTLAETFENLILDGIDVGEIGAGLLDPDAEIDDFFD